MKQTCGKVMGKKRGVFRKLVAFMCTFRHGKVSRRSGYSVSPVQNRGTVRLTLASDGAASCDGEESEPETAVSILGTTTSR
jgi:hypothetical protein